VADCLDLIPLQGEGVQATPDGVDEARAGIARRRGNPVVCHSERMRRILLYCKQRPVRFAQGDNNTTLDCFVASLLAMTEGLAGRAL
jgi:hypothetical protein